MEINKAISILAEHLLINGLDDKFRQKAKNISRSVYIDDLSILRQLFHNPPNEPDFYSAEKYGLGGWLSSCQFAIFEIIYNIGEETLPFVREIAWGQYDWTQGNAIELLIRFASEGIQSEELISEIKKEYPNIRYEAQLYAIQPLINELEHNQSLRQIFDQLFEIEDFKDAYDEITYVDPDPHNIFQEELYGKVVSSLKTNEKPFKKLIVAILYLEDFQYGEFSKRERDGKVRVGISEDCEMFKLEGKEVFSATLDEILEAQIVALGHWSFQHTNTNPVSIYPRAITKIKSSSI